MLEKVTMDQILTNVSSVCRFFTAPHSSIAVVDEKTYLSTSFDVKALKADENELLEQRDAVGGFNIPLQPAVFGG